MCEVAERGECLVLHSDLLAVWGIKLFGVMRTIGISTQGQSKEHRNKERNRTDHGPRGCHPPVPAYPLEGRVWEDRPCPLGWNWNSS